MILTFSAELCYFLVAALKAAVVVLILLWENLLWLKFLFWLTNITMTMM